PWPRRARRACATGRPACGWPPLRAEPQPPRRRPARSPAFARQVAAAPLAPRARVEPALEAGLMQLQERRAGRDAGAAVDRDLAIGDVRERQPGIRVQRARDPPRDRIDRLDLAAP